MVARIGPGQARRVPGSPDWGRSLAGGMQSKRAGLAPELRKFQPFPQGLAPVMRVERVGWAPIVVGVQVLFTHQGNQLSSQWSDSIDIGCCWR
jgi:hypothetical protein